MSSRQTIKPEWFLWPETAAFMHAFDAQRNTMRFVGGCVRDGLLGRKVSDIDAATSLPPEAVMEAARKSGIKTVPTGLKHGTVTAVIEKKSIEITTLRRDAACDGRHAQVEFTDDWQEDAARRDFTMNALYLSFDGELFDYTGGIEDAKAGRVKFIGDAGERITEDYLRILRFFRFFAHYGKTPPDKEALAACRACKDGIEKLSGERIQQEMLKLLAAPEPIRALRLMEETGVLAKLITCPNMRRLHAVLDAGKQADCSAQTATRLAALVSENEIPQLVERWKLSRILQEDIAALYERSPGVKDNLSESAQKKLLRRYGKEAFEQLALFASAHGGDYSSMIRLAQSWDIPEFPVTGKDLQQRGVQPGKEMGGVLRALEQKWEASNYSLSKNELLKIAHNP